MNLVCRYGYLNGISTRGLHFWSTRGLKYEQGIILYKTCPVIIEIFRMKACIKIISFPIRQKCKPTVDINLQAEIQLDPI